MDHHSRCRWWLAVAVSMVSIGCGESEPADRGGRVHGDVARTIRHELRPTDASDPFGYGGAEVTSYVSPSGRFRIWWAVRGAHAPPVEDVDGDDIPDYVEAVGEYADDVADDLSAAGWRLALGDDRGDGTPPAGGDGLFDIYLVDFTNGDGHYSRDWCKYNDDLVRQCAGHFRLENDFAGTGYPSREYAARLVLSHEYFHAVQAAYSGELPAWWSEGTATWYEEVYNPEQRDFERLTSLYFDEHRRSLDDRQRSPADGFAYGAAIFVYFLELQIGEEGVRAIFERLAAGEWLMEALEAEIASEFPSVSEAFHRFAVYNLSTGALAVSEHGYPEAQRFQGVDVEEHDVGGPVDWNLDIRPLAARYIRLDFDEAITLRTAPLEGFGEMPTFRAVHRDTYAMDGATDEILSERATRFEPSMSPLYVVVSGGVSEERMAATLRIRTPPVEMEPEVPDMGRADVGVDSTDAGSVEQPDSTAQSDSGAGSCASVGSPRHTGGPGGAWPVAALLGSLLCAVRRRR